MELNSLALRLSIFLVEQYHGNVILLVILYMEFKFNSDAKKIKHNGVDPL
uniref:Uncharacterized protein n=1 Tax=Rhizophagus irregularis (strain DAOM 181602 / DAOM 197198 / MUCL 43194) TaxID=747089 RepID=U9UXG3_RHIID